MTTSGDDPFHVLVVEDDPRELCLLRDGFTTLSSFVHLHEAKTVRAAIDVLNDWAHDERSLSLVVLDLKLPDGSGHSVLKHIRATPRLRYVPVVVLTGSASADIQHESLDLGANAHIVKPEELGELLDLIRSIHAFWLTVTSAGLRRPS